MTGLGAPGEPVGHPEGSAQPVNRRLLMVPGEQSRLAGGTFDPTRFTAHELPSNANRDPAAVVELQQLLGWHEQQLRTDRTRDGAARAT